MQSVTYHLDTSELDNRLIDSIKSRFKIRITAQFFADESFDIIGEKRKYEQPKR